MRICFFILAGLFLGLVTLAQKPIERNVETRVIIRDGSGNGEKPFVIIDGKPGGDLQSLSPDQILSVDVLKGNAATSFYGADGKNGVIIIKTRSGSDTDTLPIGNKKVERIVTVNKIRKSDGAKDTTIIMSDSITVNVDGDRIEIKGMPSLRGGDRIIQGFPLPDLEGAFWEDQSAPKVGVSVQDTEEGKGVLVTAVVSNGAAAKAGIQVDDRIVSVDQIATLDVDALKRAIGETRNRRSVMVRLFRAKKEMNIELVYPREIKRADL